MKFPYARYSAKPIPSHPSRKSIIRPIIPIRLVYQNKITQWYDVLIDSGADYCVFHARIGTLIDIDIKSGKPLDFVGIAGKPQKAYFHNIKIEVSGIKSDCYAGFSYDLKTPYGLLEQDGFFNLYTVIFDREKEVVELHPKKK